VTFQELQNQVLQELEEDVTTPVFHLRSYVRDAINNGYRCLAEATEFYVSSEPRSVDMESGVLHVTVPSIDDNGVLGITRVKNGVTEWWMRFETPQFMDFSYREWTNVSGQPEILVLRGYNVLQSFPQPSTTALAAWQFYVSALPPDLLGDGEEPLFPRQFHRALVEYALYELLLQEKDVTGAMEHYNEYLREEVRLLGYLGHSTSRVPVLGGSL